MSYILYFFILRIISEYFLFHDVSYHLFIFECTLFFIIYYIILLYIIFIIYIKNYLLLNNYI